MGRFVFKLPDVGEGVAEAEVVGWHVAVGATVALSVMMSASGSSSRMACPGLTCQATISASVMPSPISGNLTT